MKTHIYAVYLPGSATPDYVGSHAAEPSPRSPAGAWRYAHCRYVGAGAWVFPGDRLSIPRLCAEHSPWAAKLASLSPADLQGLRVDVLATVDAGERWVAEAVAIRAHAPPFNKALRDGPEVKRARHNAYHRGYRAGYYERNPDKAQAKRDADKARIAARRAAAKVAVA